MSDDPAPASEYLPALPGSTTAVVLTAFPASLDRADQFVAMLSARGYQVTASLGTITPALLRHLPATPIGIFYIDTHGLSNLMVAPPGPSGTDDDAAPAPTLAFGLATTQLTTDPRSAEDTADLKAQPPRLIPDSFPIHAGTPGGNLQATGVQNVLFATRDFFDHYWGPGTFAPASLVYIDGCFSADDGFQNICTAAGAGLLLGWPDATESEDTAATAAYVFDRMLGASKQDPAFFRERRAQRPFTWPQVQQTFATYQSAIGDALGTSFAKNPDGSLSRFSLNAVVNGNVGLLVPSITFLGAIEFTNQLAVNGSFGPDPGEGNRAVTLGASAASSGAALKVQSWTPNLILCELSPGAAGAGQACGFVVVNVGGRTSNCVPLTAWSGQIIVRGYGNDPTFQEEITLDCHLRLDGHLVRTQFTPALLTGDAYAPFPRMANATQDSTCSYTGSGSEEDPASDTTSTLSGSGSFPPASSLSPPPSGPPTTFNAMLQLDSTVDVSLAETHTVTLMLFFPQQTGIPPDYAYALQLTSQSPGQAPSTSNVDALTFCDGFGPVKLLQNSAVYDLPDPETPLSNLGGLFPNAVLQVNLTVACPPNPAMGEDYAPPAL